MRVALAVECIHVYSLIHDDLPCMDDDDLRRGKPTLHRAFDESTAVLAGDSLHALAFEILADEATHEDPFVRAELVAELARASGPAGMAGGQMMDLAAPALDARSRRGHPAAAAQDRRADRLVPRGRRDHGPRAARGPHRPARLCARRRPRLPDRRRLLDHEGAEEKAGKRVGKDPAAGKQTFVSLLGAERARQQADMLVDQAIEHLQAFGEEADLLRAVARFAVERDH